MEERRIWTEKHMEEMFTMVKETRDQLREQNGTIKRHNEEIFGTGNHPGLRREMDDCHDFVVATRSSVKTIVTILSVIGLANLVALILLIANITGGST